MNIIHFKTAHSWSAAREMLASIHLNQSTLQVFDFTVFAFTFATTSCVSFRWAIERSKAHFGDFVISQANKGEAEARRRSPTPRIGHTVWQRVYGGANSRVPGARVRTRARTGTG